MFAVSLTCVKYCCRILVLTTESVQTLWNLKTLGLSLHRIWLCISSFQSLIWMVIYQKVFSHQLSVCQINLCARRPLQGNTVIVVTSTIVELQHKMFALTVSNYERLDSMIVSLITWSVSGHRLLHGRWYSTAAAVTGLCASASITRKCSQNPVAASLNPSNCHLTITETACVCISCSNILFADCFQ